MSKYVAFYNICYTQLMSITWRIVVKICLNPCPWYCGCSSVSGSRYGRCCCCHQTNNNKTWSGTATKYPRAALHHPHINSSVREVVAKILFQMLRNVETSSLPLLTVFIYIDLNDEKSARKERFWKYLQATSVQRRPCLGAVMMSLCHTEASCP